MIKDRGTIKWTAMMLPEHVRELKDLLVDEEKIQRPILDEQEIEEIESIILEAMEFNQSLIFQIYDNGFNKYIAGRTQYIDHINKNFRVTDDEHQLRIISIKDLITVHKA